MKIIQQEMSRPKVRLNGATDQEGMLYISSMSMSFEFFHLQRTARDEESVPAGEVRLR